MARTTLKYRNEIINLATEDAQDRYSDAVDSTHEKQTFDDIHREIFDLGVGIGATSVIRVLVARGLL